MNLSRRLSLLILLLILLSTIGCAPDTDIEIEDAVSADQPAATATPDGHPAAIQEAWEEGPHADTYALEKGPNTYCARCHSPANWDASAAIDPPPNCVSCKFAFEPEPRVAAGNPLVDEDDWQSIACDICHSVEDGVVQAQIAWYDRQTGYYETMSSSTELCSHCHRDTETLRHARQLGDEAHADFSCTDCHDAHSTVSGCGGTDCHEDVIAAREGQPAQGGSEHAGHTPEHAPIACVACHDAAGLEVGPLEGEGTWTTFRTVELLGRSSTESYQSHQLRLQVDCARCHFAGNPWGLSEEVDG
jgi:hypothetical protein